MNDEIAYLAFNWISTGEAVDIVLICLSIVTPICMMAIGLRSFLSQKKGAFDQFIIWLMLRNGDKITYPFPPWAKAQG